MFKKFFRACSFIIALISLGVALTFSLVLACNFAELPLLNVFAGIGIIATALAVLIASIMVNSFLERSIFNEEAVAVAKAEAAETAEKARIAREKELGRYLRGEIMKVK